MNAARINDNNSLPLAWIDSFRLYLCINCLRIIRATPVVCVRLEARALVTPQTNGWGAGHRENRISAWNILQKQVTLVFEPRLRDMQFSTLRTTIRDLPHLESRKISRISLRTVKSTLKISIMTRCVNWYINWPASRISQSHRKLG